MTKIIKIQFIMNKQKLVTEFLASLSVYEVDNQFYLDVRKINYTVDDSNSNFETSSVSLAASQEVVRESAEMQALCPWPM